MRRWVLLVAFAWAVSFTYASTTSWAYTRYKIWRDFGEQFQLGYIVGYLEGVLLAKRHDARVQSLVLGGRQDHLWWKARVSEFYEDPANADRDVPEAIAIIGRVEREKEMEKRRLRIEAERARRRVPAPSPSGKPQEAPIPNTGN